MTTPLRRLRAGAALLVLVAVGAGCGGTAVRASLPSSPGAPLAASPVALDAADPTSTSTVDTTPESTTTTSTSTTTTTEPSTTTSTSATTTTEPSTTTSSSTSTTSTTVAPASNSSSSTPWGWIIAGIVLAAAILIAVILLIQRNNRIRALQAWRRDSESALDAALLALNLLPPSGQDVPDPAHWQAVRAQVEQAAQALERSSVSAPTEEGGRAATTTAETLRGLFFALDSDRLLRDGAIPPTPEQLVQADAVTRARRADVEHALAQLEYLVRPPARP
jgi:hypothetical protein